MMSLHLFFSPSSYEEEMVTIHNAQNRQFRIYPRQPFVPFAAPRASVLTRACNMIGQWVLVLFSCNMIGPSFIHVNQDE